MSPQELADKVGENIGTSEWVDMSQESSMASSRCR